MRLSKNSWHYKFYIANYKYDANQNFCDYFWSSLLAILSLPLTWSMLIFQKIAKESWGFLSKFIVGGMVDIALLDIIYAFYTNWTHALMFIIMMLLGGGLVVGIITLIVKFSESKTKDNISRNIGEITSIVSEGFKSFKDSYCPKISWKEKH